MRFGIVALEAVGPLLTRIADRGVPVFVVPGNHERGRIPHLRFVQHPGIHVFDRPRTLVAEVKDVRIAVLDSLRTRSDEEKGFLMVECTCNDDVVNVSWTFRHLSPRPLVTHDLQLDGLTAAQVESAIRLAVADAPADAVISVRVRGAMPELVSRVLSASFLRAIAPASRKLDLSIAARNGGPSRPRAARQSDDVLEPPK